MWVCSMPYNTPRTLRSFGESLLLGPREPVAGVSKGGFSVSTSYVSTAAAASSLASVCRVKGRLQSGTASTGWVIRALMTA